MVNKKQGCYRQSAKRANWSANEINVTILLAASRKCEELLKANPMLRTLFTYSLVESKCITIEINYVITLMIIVEKRMKIWGPNSIYSHSWCPVWQAGNNCSGWQPPNFSACVRPHRTPQHNGHERAHPKANRKYPPKTTKRLSPGCAC